MTGVGDELLLRLHVFEIRRDGPPGEENHKAKYDRKAEARNRQGDPEQ